MEPEAGPRGSEPSAAGDDGPAGPVVLFDAGRQAVKVRGLLLVCLLGTLAAVAFTLGAAETVVGTGGSDLAYARLRLGLILSGLFAALTLGMRLYAQCYVTRLEIVDDEPGMRVHTLGPLRDRMEEVHPARIDDTVYKHGSFGRVHAPWWTVWVRGRSLPLVIDAQGDLRDERRLLRVLNERHDSVAISRAGAGDP